MAIAHHQAFKRHIEGHPQAADLLRVCQAYKTAAGGYAFELNGRLKGGLELGAPFDADMPFLKQVICAKLSEPITLYRMTSRTEFSVPYIDAMRGEFRYQAFMSTADDASGLNSFAPTTDALLLEISFPAGFAFAPMDLFPGTDENEYLLGCGTTFKALDSPRRLSSSETQGYIPLYTRRSLDFLRLEVTKNPPYVVGTNLITL